MENRLSQIQDILNQEIAQTEELGKILRKEYEALMQMDLAIIQTSAEVKLSCISELNELCQRREDIITGAGYSSDEAGLNHFLAEHAPEHQNILILWKRFSLFVQNAKRQNSINGELVSALMRRTQDALAVLRGLSSTPAACYNPMGRSDMHIPAQILAKI